MYTVYYPHPSNANVLFCVPFTNKFIEKDENAFYYRCARRTRNHRFVIVYRQIECENVRRNGDVCVCVYARVFMVLGHAHPLPLLYRILIKNVN